MTTTTRVRCTKCGTPEGANLGVCSFGGRCTFLRDTGTHRADCQKPGMRYGATIRTTAATLKDGTAGKVVMFCKNPRCSGKLVV